MTSGGCPRGSAQIGITASVVPVRQRFVPTPTVWHGVTFYSLSAGSRGGGGTTP